MHAILYTWSINKLHLADQVNHAGNTLLTDLPEIYIPFLGQTQYRNYTLIKTPSKNNLDLFTIPSREKSNLFQSYAK